MVLNRHIRVNSELNVSLFVQRNIITGREKYLLMEMIEIAPHMIYSIQCVSDNMTKGPSVAFSCRDEKT